jgi:hypothetical protein
MRDKVEKRERRRQERLEAERQAIAKEKRRRLVGVITAAVLLAATVGAVILAASAGEDGGAATAEAAFGTHYEGLEDRQLDAGVPTMSDAEAGGAHIHPSLAVYARGEEVEIPVNIGIDPSNPPEMMAGLHTHDSSGVIHVENAAEPTLGQFFRIWGVPFSEDRLGPHEARGAETVRMWVDGEPSREFGDLVLEDGQEVVVAYGGERGLPPGLRP